MPRAIPARWALPLPPGSARLRRARYNNARVAKTTREINICFKKKKKEKEEETNRKVAALFLRWGPNPSQRHPCTRNRPRVWPKREEEIPAPPRCFPPQEDAEGAWKSAGEKCAMQRLGRPGRPPLRRDGGAGSGLLVSISPLQAQTAPSPSLEHVDRNTDGSRTSAPVSQDVAEGWACVLEVQTTFQEEQEHPTLPRERSSQGCRVGSTGTLSGRRWLCRSLDCRATSLAEKPFPARRDPGRLAREGITHLPGGRKAQFSPCHSLPPLPNQGWFFAWRWGGWTSRSVAGTELKLGTRRPA